MDDVEASPWSAPTAPMEPQSPGAGSPDREWRPGRARVIWRGATTGFRIASYITGPIAGVIALAYATPTALGLGARRGFGLHPALPSIVGFYLVFVMWGVIAGVVVGLFLGLSPSRAGLMSAANRPIRLRFWRKASVDTPVRRSRRWPWVVAALAWLVLAAAYGLGAYLGRLVDRRLAAATAAADQDDPHWRIDDLLAHRKPVPDEENSAFVVSEIIALLPKNWPSGPARQPPRRTEAEIACDKATEAQENVQFDVATADALRRQLDEHGEAVRLARTVADYKRGRLDPVLGPALIDTPLPEATQARTVARLLAIDVASRANDGDIDGALDSCRALIGVGRSIGDAPFVVAQLVRGAVDGLAVRSVRRALGQGEPSDEALARLQALVLDEMNAPLLLDSMRGERATLPEVIRRIGAGELSLDSLSGQGTSSRSSRTVASWSRLSLDYQRAVGLEWMNEAVAIARRPPTERAAGWKAWEDEIERTRYSRTGLDTVELPMRIVGGLSVAATASARVHTELGATGLMLAAERHRRKTGVWPASSDAILPEILTNPPLDPFSGKPFIFERRDGRLIVHSVGPNLRDEHGAYEPKRWNTGGPDDVGATAWDVALRRQPAH